MIETFLNTLPGPETSTRIDLFQISPKGETPFLELRQMRDCGSLGWQLEKRIRLGSGSIPLLREGINKMDLKARQPARAKLHGPHLTLVPSGEFGEAV